MVKNDNYANIKLGEAIVFGLLKQFRGIKFSYFPYFFDVVGISYNYMLDFDHMLLIFIDYHGV